MEEELADGIVLVVKASHPADSAAASDVASAKRSMQLESIDFKYVMNSGKAGGGLELSEASAPMEAVLGVNATTPMGFAQRSVAARIERWMEVQDQKALKRKQEQQKKARASEEALSAARVLATGGATS